MDLASQFQVKTDETKPTVRDNDRYPLGNGLLGNTERQVVGQENGRPGIIEAAPFGRSLNILLKQTDIVPASISELLGVPGPIS